MKLLCILIVVTLTSPVFAKDFKVSKSVAAKELASNSDVDSPSDESAPDTPKVRKTRSGKRIVKLQSDEVLEGSSEDHRQNKMFSLTWEMFGLIEVPASGGSLGYYITPDNIMEISHVEGRWNVTREKTKFTSIRLKTFWGNSFYSNLGLAARSEAYTSYPNIYYESTYYDGVVVRENALGVDFAIGNRWQWENFTMGCDWVGFFSPMSKNLKVIDDRGQSDEYIQAALNDDSYRGTGSLQLLRFYLGLSF